MLKHALDKVKVPAPKWNSISHETREFFINSSLSSHGLSHRVPSHDDSNTDCSKQLNLIPLQGLVDLLNPVLCNHHHLQSITDLNVSFHRTIKSILDQILDLVS
jgi:hypothetical protein